MGETYRVYTGTVADLLERPDVAAIFYARISGIPYVFASGPIPSRWDIGGGQIALDGDAYTWVGNLDTTALSGITQKTEPKAGLGVSGQLSLRLWLSGTDNADSDPLLSLLVRNLFRTDGAATNLGDTLLASSAGPMTVASTTGFAAAGYIYAGLETIAYTATAATEFQNLTRGAFGSWPIEHRYENQSTHHSSPVGAIIADWPLVWEGRIVEVWIGFGTNAEGSFIPYENGAGDRIEQQIYQGILSGVDEDLAVVTLECASLDQMLATKLPQSAPHACLLHWEPSRDLYPLNRYNSWLFWSWQVANAATTANDIDYLESAYRMLDPTGVSQIPIDALYTTAQLALAIRYTLQDANRPAPSSIPIKSVYLVTDYNESGDPRLRLTVVADGNLNGYKLVFYPESEGKRMSILKMMGYTDAIEADSVYSAGPASTVFQFPTAPAAPYAVWIPGEDRRLGPSIDVTLYLEPGTTDDEAFTDTPGWVDDDGADVVAFAKIDKWGVVSFGAPSTEVSPYGETIDTLPAYQLGSSARGWFSLWGAGDLEIRYTQEHKGGEISQCMAITNISLGAALAYIVCGGSGSPGTLDATYDQGWHGAGLAMPARVLNITELEESASFTTRRDLIMFSDPPEEARKWLADELKIDQVLCVASANWLTGSNAALTFIATTAPQEATSSTIGYTVDGTVLRSLGAGSGLKIDRSDGLLVNRIDIELGQDYASKKYRYEVHQTHITSMETWGSRGNIKFRVPSLAAFSTGVAVDDIAAELARRFFDRYAFPYEVISLTVAHLRAWTWRPGDVLLLNSGVLPDLNAAGRGNDDLPCKIYEIEHRYAAGPVSAKIIAVAHSSLGERFSLWSPAAVLDSIHVADTVWNVADHDFSDSADPIDLSWFAANDVVLLWRRGSPTAFESKTIQAVDLVNGRVTFTANVNVAVMGVGGDIVMSFGAYDTSTARQQAFVALANTSNQIDNGPGLDAAFVYQE